MNIYIKVAALLLAVVIVSCSSKKEEEIMETTIQGRITVADSLDRSGDFSGIQIIVVDRDSVGAAADTVFHAITKKSGEFKGKAQFESKSYYPLLVSRNGSNIGQVSVILAKNDTLTLNTELPGLNKTVTLDSREHRAMEVFQRVDRGFQRIAGLARAGVIPDTQLVEEMTKWADLYWEVEEKHKNTLASWFAIEKTAQILRGIDSELMMERIDAGLPAGYVVGVAVNYGKPYLAEAKGLEAASSYLDSLMQISENDDIKELVLRNKIEMYFDSSKVREAKQMLEQYEEDYNNKPSSKKWTQSIRYDLNYLAPGLDVPHFSFVTLSGDSVNTESLKGTPYIVEISPLANREYMDDYDRTIVIYEIYKNYGLKIFTVPLDQSQVTVNGFFEERRQVWPVAEIGSFDVQSIIEKFNVTQVPTRFLVDENGVLVRKYVRGEFEDIIQGLNSILNKSNNES